MVDIAKLEAFVQSSQHPAWLATSNGDCVYANSALERLTGLNSDQITHTHWRSFLLEEDRAAATASWQGSLPTGTPYRTQVRMRGFDGIPATVELIAFGHRLKDGTELWLFAGLHVNGAIQPYLRLEAQLQATLNVIPAYTWYALPSGALTFVNVRTADYLGLPKDHPLRSGIATGAAWDSHIPLLHPDDHEETRKVWSTCLRTGSAGEVSFRVRNAEGGYRWFLSRAEPLRASDGTLLYWIGVNLDIDERKRAEQELRDVIDTIPAIAWSALPDGSNNYVNSRFTEYSGMSAEQSAGSGWKVALHPDDLQQHVRKWMASVATGAPFENELRFRRVDGQYRWHLDRGVPLRDEAGNIARWYGVVTDIEDRKRAEEALRRNEYYLAEGQRLAQMGSWAFNPVGFFTHWSRELLRIYGLDLAQEAPSLEEYLALIHPQDREFMRSLIKKMVAEALGCDVTKRIVRPDGEIRYIRCVGAPVVEDGTLQRIVGTAIDVTEHELLTRELRRREAYLAEAQRLSHTGSFGWKPDNGEIVWSEETYRIFEYDRTQKPTVDSVVQRVHPHDRALVQQVMDRASQTGTDFEHEYRLLLAEGRVKYVHAIAHALQDASGNREFVGAVSDITETREAEEALRRSQHYLAEAQTLTHVGSWVWQVAGRDAVHLSDEWYRIYGFDPKQGMPKWEERLRRVHPGDRDLWQGTIERAIRERSDYEVEFRILLPDGTLKWIHTLAHRVLNASGDVDRFVGSSMDVTERKRAEEKIREQERELRQLLDLAPQYLGVLEADGSPFYANRASLDYLGMSLDEWRQRRSIGDEVHPDDVERLIAESNRASSTGSAYELEVRVRKGDGSYRWFLSRFNPLHDDKGQVKRWYIASTDIDERKRAEEKLQLENAALREEIDQTSMFEEIVGTSPALQTVLSRISKVAPNDSTVLITGETGTGKELVARAIHKRSRRSGRPFVSVNCAAIPRDLIGSELFGHEKGAFTGAMQRRLGRFEMADGGTIFLDEVGELSPDTQVALLRVLQEREFDRVGGGQPIRVNVRVIAATNRDLKAAAANGTFRQDLFYRLNVFPIEVPPLRERKGDILILVEYFAQRYATRAGKKIHSIDKTTLDLLQSYDWPGNIRELQNVIERSVILSSGEVLAVDELWLAKETSPPASRVQASAPSKVEDEPRSERDIIEAALAATRGRVSGPSGAAAKLRIPPSTLYNRIKSLKINKNQFKFQ